MILEFVTKCLWVFFAITRPVSDIVLDLLYRVLARKTRELPPIKSKLLLMSATELAKAIRKKRVTSEEVVSTYIERIREVNPIINACIDQRFEDALEDARRVDEILRTGILNTEGEIERELPLMGVPFTCKEILGVEGLRQTMGLRRFEDRKAPADAETVALYKKAGAIPLMVTNIPTISMWWQTSNALFGMTVNPYNSHRMVGGSSGGEAAAIASAASVIGIGTDIGGSIRIPACFCGIYGHKPSRGIVSNHRPTPSMNMKVDPFRSTGPMCRYAEDLPLLLKILSGEEGTRKLQLDKKVDFTRINLYFIEGFPGLLSPIPAIKSAIRKAVQHFEGEFGIRARRLEAEELASAFDIWMYKFLEADGSPLLPDLTDEKGDMDWPLEMLRSLLGLSEYDIPILYFAAIGKRRKDREYFRCLDLFRKLDEKFQKCLRGDTVLLVPTFPELPPHTTMSIPKVENTAYTSIFNSLGCPATQVPAGLVGGLPIGVQAVASRYNDRLTLAAAVELEKVFGGWKSPSAVRVDA